jgi:hypothetical protein
MRLYTFTPAADPITITIKADLDREFYAELGEQLGRDGQALRASSVGANVWDGDEHLGSVRKVEVREIWTTSTKHGERYYYFNTRTLPMRKADALAMIANGTAVLVERPEFLGAR